MALSREEVLAALDARQHAVDPIEVPEWGGTIYARRLSVADLKASGLLAGTSGDPADLPIRLLIACLADENGELLFKSKDAATLAGAEFTVAFRIFAAIAKANGLSNMSLEEAMAAFATAQGSAGSTD